MRSATTWKTSSTGRPCASADGHPVNRSASAFMNRTRPTSSVAMTPSPMLPSVAASHCSFSRSRRSTSCRYSAISIAVCRSRSSYGFRTYPNGSVIFARWSVSGSELAVRYTTGTSNCPRMRAAASMPSISPSRRMSMSTKSGRRAAAFATASAPLAASAGTAYPMPASCF